MSDRTSNDDSVSNDGSRNDRRSVRDPQQRTELVATLTHPPASDGADLKELSQLADVLEVRGDLVGDLEVEFLRQHFSGRLLYTLRSRAEGGKSEAGKARRQQRLSAAAEGYDLVDLEAERDLFPELLVQVPASKRLISWHGPAIHLTALRQRFEHMTSTEARYYKVIPIAAGSGDGIRALALLRSLGREDVISFGVGEIATWTRLLAPRLGSPWVYGSASETPAAPGQLSVARLRRDYGLPELPPIEGLYGIAGRPVLHSLSPRLHNGAYRELGLPYLYLPFHIESFGDFWIEVVESGSLEDLGFPLRGLSVTAPYKEVALAVSGASSPRAQHICAANTLVKSGEVWEAETTDPEGVVEPLRRWGVAFRGVRAAIVGCGGAGRAAAYGLQLEGARVTLVNRGEERGKKASTELALPFVALDAFDPSGFDIIIHATGLGHGENDPLPFDVAAVASDATVVDLVYGRHETALVEALEARGIAVVPGREALFAQALPQFLLMTRYSLDEDLARRLLRLPEGQAQ